MRPLDRSEKKILSAFLFILVTLGFLAIFSTRNSKRIMQSAEDVDRSQEIKFHLEKAFSMSSDMAAAARGYVITGNENYLEPNNKNIATIFSHLSALKDLYTRDREKTLLINELEDLIDKRISLVTRLTEIRKDKGLNEALVFFATGSGKPEMEKIRSIVDRMISEEDKLLGAEKEINQANIRSFNFTFDMLLVAIAITVMSIFFLLRYYFKERTRAISVLHEHKELLQSIIDNSPSLVFVKDLSGRYKLANKRYEKLFHVPKEEIQGKTDYDIFPPEVAEGERHSDLEVVRHKKPLSFERELPINNRWSYYLSSKFPLIDNEQFVYAVGGIATDITERKRYERILKERSDVVLDLFNNAPFGYHSVDKNFILTEMNETELHWLGYRRDEVIGKMNAFDLYADDSRKLAERLRERILNRELHSIHDQEMRYRRKDGTIFPVVINSVINYDSNGAFSNYKTALFDITARKKAESTISQN
jgi:two-component system, NarL family, sensor kinase